jgi:hypothetical protein
MSEKQNVNLEVQNLEVVQKTFNNVKATDELPFEKKLQMIEVAIQNKLLPAYVKTKEVGLMLIEKAKELGLPPFASFDMFYQVNGKLALQSNGLAAIIKKNGGRYRVVRNNELVYETTNPKNYYLTGDYVRYDPTTKKQVPQDHTPFILRPMDIKVTTIIATRPDEGHQVEHIVNFTSLEAHSAQLLTKDVWIKYPEAMMFNRCLAKMARQVFPDYIAGMYPAEELDDKNTLNYNSEGQVIGEKS